MELTSEATPQIRRQRADQLAHRPPRELNQKDDRNQRRRHGHQVDSLATKKAAQTEAQKARNQHVVLQKSEDAHFRRHPANHQQFEEQSKYAR